MPHKRMNNKSNKRKVSKSNLVHHRLQAVNATESEASDFNLSSSIVYRNMFDVASSSNEDRVSQAENVSQRYQTQNIDGISNAAMYFTRWFRSVFNISDSSDDDDIRARHRINYINHLFGPIPLFGQPLGNNISISKTLEPFVIKKDSLKTIIAGLGDGACGQVFLQPMLKPNKEYVLVAVKNAKDFNMNKWLLKEAEILSKLKHENIVGLLGFVKAPGGGFHELVMEYLPIGNLVEVVKVFETTVVLKLLCDICHGMQYINDQKLVHRDLACRNVFVSSSAQAKIGDFGLCRHVDDEGNYYDEEMRLSGYNISPEAYISKIFSTKSEIWAMGILCWELFYFEERDYSHFKTLLNFQAFDWSSSKLPKSKACPEMLYKEVIIRCFNIFPKERPSFEYIHKKIGDIIKDMK